MEKASLTIGAVCNGCLVYEQQGQHMVVLVDTPSWYAWLETATTFTFTCEEEPLRRTRRGLAIGGVGGTGEPIGASADDSRAVTWASPPISRWRNCGRRPAAWQQMVRGQEAETDEDTPPLVPVPISFQGLTPTVILQSSITPPRLPCSMWRAPACSRSWSRACEGR